MSHRSSPRRTGGSPRRSRTPTRTTSAPTLLSAQVQPDSTTSKRSATWTLPILVVLLGVLLSVIAFRNYALQYSVQYVPQAVPLLLELLGADPSLTTDPFGLTALHLLCASSQPSLHAYKSLHEHGADLSATDCLALQPVHYCSISSPALATQLLLDGARQAPGSPSLIHPILEALLARKLHLSDEALQYIKRALPLCHSNATNLPLGDGLAPLAAAFVLRTRTLEPNEAAHSLDLAQLLIDSGAQPNTLHPDGTPLLHYCLQFCSGLANDDIYDDAEARQEFLAVLFDSPALNVSETDVDHRTPLFFACNATEVTALLERGADPNAVSLLGETPLEYHMRLLHDTHTLVQEAGVIAALWQRGARLGEKHALLSALTLHDNALAMRLEDHITQIVEFATTELKLPFLRLLDVSGQELGICFSSRDVLVYTKDDAPPIRSVLDGALEVTALNGSFVYSTYAIPTVDASSTAITRGSTTTSSSSTTELRISLRDLDRVYIRPIAREGCILMRATLRS